MFAYVTHTDLADTITVVKGCLTTLARHWDQLSNDQRRLLLDAAEHSADRLGEIMPIEAPERSIYL